MQDARVLNPPQVEGHVAAALLSDDQGMPYTPLTKRALDLSFEAHRDQRDKSGRPYVYHPFHLADQMRDETSACVALLHDVVEDGHYSLEDLRRAGMTDEVVAGVAALTHDLAVPYLTYVMGLRANPVARVVKLADLRHNANLSRLDEVTDKDRRRRVRYLMEQAVLCDDADVFDDVLGELLWHKRIPLDDQGLHVLSVFYDVDGAWRYLSYDAGAEACERCLFDVAYADALARELGGPSLLDALARSGPDAIVDALARAGVPLQHSFGA